MKSEDQIDNNENQIETDNYDKYNIRELTAAVEALLFASGEPVELDSIAEITDMDRKTAKSFMDNMAINFENAGRGIIIREIGSSYQMCAKPCYYEYIAKLTAQRQKQALSQAALEVLSIIAYRQPVTKAVVDSIRGVNSDSAFERLLDRNLIIESGKLEAPGRPKLYATTEEFLRSFGLRGLGDLPDLSCMEEQGEAAEAEADAGADAEAEAEADSGAEIEALPFIKESTQIDPGTQNVMEVDPESSPDGGIDVKAEKGGVQD